MRLKSLLLTRRYYSGSAKYIPIRLIQKMFPANPDNGRSKMPIKHDFELITEVNVNADRFCVKIDSGLKTDFFLDDFYLRVPGQELKNLPEEVLLVPFFLNVAPVIWASGLKVIVDKMDRALFESLQRVKHALTEMYPRVDWSGDIVVRETMSINLDHRINSCAILFSGGLDSVASSYRHLSEKQTLVMVRGSDIALDDHVGWEVARNSAHEYATKIGANVFFLESNFYNFLNHSRLGALSDDIPAWWAYVQHGIGLAGMMAIPSWLDKTVRAYIASTHSDGFGDSAWGSSPKIDNEVEWFGVRVVHDGFDLTRQGKVEYIGKKAALRADVPLLRVCYSSAGGNNCCVCEKCSRTMSGILVSGARYQQYGFGIPEKAFMKNTRRLFLWHRIVPDRNTLFHWGDIQAAVRDESFYWARGFGPELIGFIGWLKSVDLQAYARRHARYAQVRGFVKRVAVSVPGVYRFVTVIRRLR